LSSGKLDADISLAGGASAAEDFLIESNLVVRRSTREIA